VIQAGPARRLPRPAAGAGVAVALTAAVLAGSAMTLKARSFAKLAQTAPPPAPVSAPALPPARTRGSAPVALAEAPAQAQILSDTIRSDAGAPERPRPDDIQLYLQARRSARALELRTGPGANYPLLGLGDLDERYPVLEIRNRWFRIQLEETPGLSAWVPYERIELFSKDKDPAKEISSD
jgi:hypothetical protein